ncbi:conjugal transfer protein TraI [Terrimonas pollutisoli]|uniref:conjugal transfer protein TraI n=1 Tax=Terrimonas pollutisoli TaxID=3034147 RepID=UPI0023EC78AF|nr:conjugal transfer protein TraI [Terrimonas sp. H1YJ31]
MKKLLAMTGLICCLTVMPIQKTEAQIPILEIIKQGIKKVIIAVDLKIQRLQNKTIWLQNAQKTLENTMSKLKLDEISDWVEKQRKLYADYFDELWKVKAALTYYHRVKEIIEGQVQMVGEYKVAWALFRQDKNFTADELDYIHNIYTGMFDESLKSIDQLFLVVNAFATQMSDAKRLEIINTVSDNLQQQFMDLKDFNDQNKMISLQRASGKGEIEYVKKLYGL